jgi:hypothetical protein
MDRLPGGNFNFAGITEAGKPPKRCLKHVLLVA